MVTCPKCTQVLGEIGRNGTLDTICSSCQFKFFVLKGRLVGGTSRLVTVREETHHAAGAYKRTYNLRVELPGGRAEVIDFSLNGRDDSVDVQLDNAIAAIFSMRGTKREELLDVYDLTMNRRYNVSAPGTRSSIHAALAGAGAGVVTILVIAQVAIPPIAAVMAVATVFGGTWFGFSRLFAPTHALLPEQKATLAASQQLLATKRDLLVRRNMVTTELDQRSETRDRLVTLRNKMREVGSELYTERIVMVSRGVEVLDEQMRLDKQLLDVYAKSVTMVEIEYESAMASDAISPDGEALIRARLNELEALRNKHADLKRQLAANDEVEALLKGG